ncbi:MAG: hypothetical protein AB2826_27625 [Candidatus Thiodiazotropha sp.]
MSLESEIKTQYEEFFRPDDWSTFKCAADYYFENAATVLKKDIQHNDNNLKLLFRNIQKRLYIGIACEFLLKAIFLKNGYVINKRVNANTPQGKYPFIAADVDPNYFDKSNTLTFNDLLQKLFKVIEAKKGERKAIEKGLKIAKVFRNKEGHAVTVFHDYNPQNYRDIEDSLALTL